MYSTIEFEILPTHEQISQIQKNFKVHKSVYNFVMDLLKRGYKTTTSKKDANKLLMRFWESVKRKINPDIRNVNGDIYRCAIRHAINAYNKGFKRSIKASVYNNTLPIRLIQDKPGFFRVARNKYFRLGLEYEDIQFPKNITLYSVYLRPKNKYTVVVIQNNLINEDEVKKEKIPYRGFEGAKIQEADEYLQERVSIDTLDDNLSSDTISSEIVKNLDYLTSHEISDEEKIRTIKSMIEDNKNKPIREKIKEVSHNKSNYNPSLE